MNRILPALHEGHAPVDLHQAFEDALDAFEAWGLDMEEPTALFDGREVPISSVFGRMRSCLDMLPERIRADAVAVIGVAILPDPTTYADAARVLRSLCVEKLRARAA